MTVASQQLGLAAWRDYVTDGVAASGYWTTRKADIRAFVNELCAEMSAIISLSTATVLKPTLAALNLTTPTIGVIAAVVLDTAANNGIYLGNGTSWVYQSALPADSAAGSALAALTSAANAATSAAASATSATASAASYAAAEALVAGIGLLSASAPFYGTFAGGSNTITLPVTPTTSAQVYLTVGGVGQTPSTYTVSGATITLAESPPAGVDYVGIVLASSPIQTLPIASRAALSDIVAGVEMGKWTAPATVKQAFELGGAPVALFAGASAYDLPSLIARHGLTPYESPYFNATAGADNSAAFNDIIARVIAAGGGSVIIPPGVGGADWAIGSSLSIYATGVTALNLNVFGLGQKARIAWLGTTGDVWKVGDGTNPVYYLNIANIYMYSPYVRSSGIEFNFQNANIMSLTDIVTDGTYAGFNGINLNSIYGSRIIFNMPNQTSGAGVNIFSDPAGSGRTDIVKFDELTVQASNAGSYGIVLNGNVNGFHTDGAYMLGTHRGLQLVSSSTTIVPSFCEFYKLETDRAVDCSVVMAQSYRTEFHRCDISNTSGAMDVPYPQGSADGTAFQMQAGAQDTKIIGSRVGNSQQSALSFLGDGLYMGGTTLGDCSKAGSGVAPIIYVGHGAKDVHIDQCRLLGYSRASYAAQMESDASGVWLTNNGYRSVVTGFSAGSPANLTSSGNAAV